MEYKKYKTIDEQIEYLKENKKIIVDDEDRHWFEDVNYISLINPYKEIFANGRSPETNCHIYANDVNFKELLKVMDIDYRFSEILYKSIRSFERKFKNLVFSEMCKTYVNEDNDKYCINYSNEIRNFLIEKSTNPPLFCPCFYQSLSRQGYIEDKEHISFKKDLLNKILLYSSGYDLEGKTYKDKANKLIKHYIKYQEITPLWCIPNILTLGEVSMLFNMLCLESQHRICLALTGKPIIINEETIDFKQLVKFTGKLEFIRNMRNTINHYEPIFPTFCSIITRPKELNNSIIISSLELLSGKLEFSHKNNDYSTNLNIEVVISSNNIIQIRLLEMMEEYIRKNQ